LIRADTFRAGANLGVGNEVGIGNEIGVENDLGNGKKERGCLDA
jgi:hypothetical protein